MRPSLLRGLAFGLTLALAIFGIVQQDRARILNGITSRIGPASTPATASQILVSAQSDNGGTTTTGETRNTGLGTATLQAFAGSSNWPLGIIAPVAGTLSDLYVNTTASNTSTFTIYKNNASTAVTCSTSSSTTCSDPASGGHSVHLAAGDAALIRGVVTTGTFAYANAVRWTPDDGVTMIYPAVGSPSVSAESAFPVQSWENGNTGAPSQWVQYVASAGTITTFVGGVAVAPGGTATWTIQPRYAGTDLVPSPTCVIATSATYPCSVGTLSQAISAGNTITMTSVPANTPASSVAANGTYGMTPTTAGNFDFMCRIYQTNEPSNSTTTYWPMNCFFDNGSSTLPADEAHAAARSPPFNLIGLTAHVDAAPGTGKSWTITFRQNGADTLATCSIANAATSCTPWAGTPIAVAAGDRIDISVTGVSSPTNPVGFNFTATGVHS